jgi:hypothetical protein
MNNCKIVLLFILGFQWANATTIKLEFNTPRDLKIKLSLYELNRLKFEKVVGTHGDLQDDRQLDDAKLIKNFSIAIKEGDVKIMALVAENLTDKELEFFVSPHEANPSEYSLDFKFNCLCYSHIYKVKPKSRWYRILRLSLNEDGISAKNITLRHQFVKWAGKKP